MSTQKQSKKSKPAVDADMISEMASQKLAELTNQQDYLIDKEVQKTSRKLQKCALN